MDAIDIMREQVKAYEEKKNFAVVTITHSDGSTPRRNGKMIVFEDGTSKGTIGGGSVEILAVQDALLCIKEGSVKQKSYDLSSPKSDTGMVCGGSIEVLIESFLARPLLLMCGAGHVGGAVLKLASFVGFDTFLVDDREEALIADKIALADRFMHVANYEQELKDMVLPENTYAVIATHGHAFDGAALSGLLGKEISYLGMIGSSKKVHALFETMKEKGFAEEQLQSVYTPIGLDLGGETPEEIAVSIIAEILMTRYGRDGGHWVGKKK